ncbi:MAG TPA: hypothetical protein VEY12_01830 [Thermoplasmata archaeon]|nr:hypothetical protein [Thermoplasmata archaeon]
MTEDFASEARAALEAGEREKALTLADRAFREHGDDPRVRELYTALHLARAIRLSARAREMRRDEIVRRDIPEDTEFEDSPEVAKAFDEAATAIEEVLAADPRSEKGLMMKASLLFRRDRAGGRPEALTILEAVATANPSNRQVLYEIRKIQTPCRRCGDSGFCPRCRGRGVRRILGMQSKCETCHGQGICMACGVL